MTFVGYLIGTLLVLPAGLAWALGEPQPRRHRRCCSSPLGVVAFLELRLDQIWSGV